MAPSSSDSVPVSAPLTTGNLHLDTIVNEYNRNHAENTATFVKSIVQLLSSGTVPVDTKMLTFNPPSEPAVASTYREHRKNNESTSDSWADGGSKSGGDSWADGGTKSGGSDWSSSGDSRPSRGSYNGGRGGRGGGNSDGPRQPRVPRPGDWTCKACNMSNFARNTQCYRRDCGAPKEDDSTAGTTTDSFSDSSKRPADSPAWDDAPTDAKKSKDEPAVAAPSKTAADEDDW